MTFCARVQLQVNQMGSGLIPSTIRPGLRDQLVNTRSTCQGPAQGTTLDLALLLGAQKKGSTLKKVEKARL